jgi:RHS repeat-associated protein
LISDGVKTFTYDSANRLITVNDISSMVNLSYNGLGQRLSMDAAGVIATYVIDGDRLLAAESAGNTTFYLYGLGAIGEKTTSWSFSLPDGTNTPRQLADINGDITLSARYTPWGDTLETHGTGNFTFGYFGGVMDAATGLLYVGNGQYYDPSTGRFLTRNANPNSPNPYVPWNPIGAILGPLGLIALVFGRRKKGSKAGTFLVLLLVVGSVGMTLAACGPIPDQDTPIPPIPEPNETPGAPGTVPTQPNQTPTAPAETPVVPCPEPETPLPIGTPTAISIDAELLKYRVILNGQIDAWKLEWKMATLDGIRAVANKFGSVMQLAPVEAFLRVFSEGINLTMGSEGALNVCADIQGGGCTSSSHQINFVPGQNLAFLVAIENRTADIAYIANRNLVVHELGHAFGYKFPERIDDPNNSDPTVTTKNPDHPANRVGNYRNKILLSDRGWPVSPVSANRTWRQHPCSDDLGTCYEIEVFADMFLGWTFDEWGTDPRDIEIVNARKDFMREYMPHWLGAFK